MQHLSFLERSSIDTADHDVPPVSNAMHRRNFQRARHERIMRSASAVGADLVSIAIRGLSMSEAGSSRGMNQLRPAPDLTQARVAKLLSGRISLMDDKARMLNVTLAVTGDADALQRLLIEHHASLIAKVRGRLGASMGRYVEPDDIVQEAYARAFRAVTTCTFESAAGFHAWLEEIALNVLRDQHRFHGRKKRDLRRNARDPKGISESYERLVEQVAATDSTPSRKLAKVEAAAAVLSSLARLTDDQRSVVELRFLKGWPVADVAEHLNKSEAAVHMLCHRGLKSLRDVLLSMSRFLSDA